MSQTQIIIQSIHDFVQQKTNNSLTLVNYQQDLENVSHRYSTQIY